jgi:uncharacterized membrane protein
MKEFENVIAPNNEFEAEQASKIYIISLMVVKVGIPLPIFNFLGVLLFYFVNRKENYFVRWHSTQTLLAQLTTLFVNSLGFWWTMSILFNSTKITNAFLAYIITLLLFNVIEYIAIIYTAIETRKGKHISWWFYGSLTQLICKP